MASKTDALLNQLRTGEQQAALRAQAERQVSTEKVLETLKAPKVLPMADTFIIPNHSGNLSAGKVLSTPTDDNSVVNKAYADSIAGGATTGSGAPASAPTTLGSFYLDTDNNILYIAMGTSSASDWKGVLTE